MPEKDRFIDEKFGEIIVVNTKKKYVCHSRGNECFVGTNNEKNLIIRSQK